jgi:hypothetical protein
MGATWTNFSTSRGGVPCAISPFNSGINTRHILLTAWAIVLKIAYHVLNKKSSFLFYAQKHYHRDTENTNKLEREN